MLYEYQLLQSSLPFLIIDCYIYMCAHWKAKVQDWGESFICFLGTCSVVWWWFFL